MRYYVKTTEHVFVEIKGSYKKVSQACWNHALYIVKTTDYGLGLITMACLLNYIMRNKISRTDAIEIISAAIEHKNNNS